MTKPPTGFDDNGLTLFELAAADPDVRFSPHCWKTRMALAHKGLKPDRIAWRFTEKSEIAFSGQGLVPVLVDQGQVVSDSWKIAVHLEANYPDRPSLFAGEGGLALCKFINAWADSVVLPALSRLIILDIHKAIDPADQDYFRASREKRFGQRLEDVCGDPNVRLEGFRAALTPARMVLASQDFLSGAAPGYADYCLFGMFMWARCVSPVQLIAPDDRLSPWREDLLGRFDGMGRNAVTAAM